MRATYTGYLSVTYMNYTDLATGKTLQVDPGGTYDIAPDIPPENFIPVPALTAQFFLDYGILPREPVVGTPLRAAVTEEEVSEDPEDS